MGKVERNAKFTLHITVEQSKPRIGVIHTKHQPNKKRKLKHGKAKHKHKEQ